MSDINQQMKEDEINDVIQQINSKQITNPKKISDLIKNKSILESNQKLDNKELLDLLQNNDKSQMTAQNTGKCNICSPGIEKSLVKLYPRCKDCNIDKLCENNSNGEHQKQFNNCYMCPSNFSKCNISNLNPETNSTCDESMCTLSCSDIENPYIVINNCSKCEDTTKYKCNIKSSKEFQNDSINKYNHLYCEYLKNLK